MKPDFQPLIHTKFKNNFRELTEFSYFCVITLLYIKIVHGK